MGDRGVLGAMDAYHPSEIMKLKRLKKDAVHDDLPLPAPEDSKAVYSNIPKVTSDAQDYLESLLGLANTVEDMILELTRITNKVVRPDERKQDPRHLNKIFQEKKRAIDDLTREPTIQGDAPLSGKYAQKPKALLYDEKTPPFELKFDAYNCKGLAIDQLRIDSLADAKGAVQRLERAKVLIRKIQPQILPKLEIVTAKIENMKVQVDNVKVNAVEKAGHDNYIDLKISQERAARAKGRTWGLLVNIKV